MSVPYSRYLFFLICFRKNFIRGARAIIRRWTYRYQRCPALCINGVQVIRDLPINSKEPLVSSMDEKPFPYARRITIYEIIGRKMRFMFFPTVFTYLSSLRKKKPVIIKKMLTGSAMIFENRYLAKEGTPSTLLPGLQCRATTKKQQNSRNSSIRASRFELRLL